MVAATAWGFAGIMLLIRGTASVSTSGNAALLFVLAGAAGLLFFKMIFGAIVKRHLTRIQGITIERPCAFSFLDWRGYIVMACMIAFGVSLRTFAFIPAAVSGTVSLTMGVPLTLSAARFLFAGISSTTSGMLP